MPFKCIVYVLSECSHCEKREVIYILQYYYLFLFRALVHPFGGEVDVYDPLAHGQSFPPDFRIRQSLAVTARFTL